MTKTEALAVLNNAVGCYIEDCISSFPEYERVEVWEAFHIVRTILTHSIAKDGDEP